MDYEEAPAAAEVVRHAGGIPQWIDGQRHHRRPSPALHRRLRDGELPEDSRCRAGHGARLHRGRQQGERRQGRVDRLWDLAARLRRRAGHRRQARAYQRQARVDRRRDGEGFCVSDERGDLDSVLQRVSAQAARRSRRGQSVCPRSAEEGRLARSGQRRGDDDRQALRRTVSGTNKAVQHRPGPEAARQLHAAVAAQHALDNAGVLRRRAADFVRQRDEHAVRARDAAREGAGGALVARRDRACGCCARC